MNLPDNLDAFIAAEGLPAGYADIVAAIHRPIAEHIAAAAAVKGKELVVGLCGAQGSGKSTMAAALKLLLEARGLSVALLSIDDLYLTREERARLAAEVHPLLATRGVPGTHDVALGLTLIDRLAQPGAVALPRFDKARDTRAPEAAWPCVEGPVDVLLFEGWCVGARPQPAAMLEAPINDLERLQDPDGRWRRFVNEALAGPYQALFGRIDLLVMLAAPSFDVVLGWRLEQEHKLRARVGGGMDDAAVAAFIRHYERLTRHILAEMPGRADMLVRLDEARQALGPPVMKSLSSEFPFRRSDAR